MNTVAQSYFALGMPVSLLLMGCVAAAIWARLPHHRQVLWYAISAGIGCVALSWQTLLAASSMLAQWVPYISVLYILTAVFLVKAIATRFDLKLYWFFTCVVGVVTLALMGYYARVEDNVKVRIFIIGCGLFAVLLQIVPELVRTTVWRGRSRVDHGLLWTYVVYMVFVIARPLMMLDSETFSQPFVFGISAIWLTTLIGSMVLGTVLGVFIMAGAALDSVQALRDQRDRDPLTGLFNRRVLQDIMSGSHLARSVVLCDLDKFKRINDQWGHGAGDEVLKATAHILSSHVREGDIVTRLGGEEFAIVLHTDLQTSLGIVERIRLCIAATAIAVPGDSVRMTASFGVVQVQQGESIQNAIHRADALLYAAKQAGRNCVRWQSLASAQT